MILGAVTGLMIIGLAWALTLGSKPADRAVPVAPASTAAPTAEASKSQPPVVESSPTAAESESVTPTPTPTPSVNGEAVTTLPNGTYITVLQSMRKSKVDLNEALARAEEISTDAHKVEVVDSDAISSLRPGYWTLAVTGSKDSKTAKAICGEMNRPFGDHCYLRKIG